MTTEYLTKEERILLWQDQITEYQSSKIKKLKDIQQLECKIQEFRQSIRYDESDIERRQQWIQELGENNE